MPSERRRQRQQRVRHEAGDYVPSCPEEVTKDPPDFSSQGDSTRIVEETTKYDHPIRHEEATPRTEIRERDRNTPPPPPPNTVRRDGRRPPDHYHKQEGGRHDFNKRMDRGGGGRGRGAHTAPGPSRHPPPSNTNVAVAEVQHEYEPVRIMESKDDPPKETGQLPQPPKYRRREVISNWLRYDEIPSDDEVADGEDYLLGEDFSKVLSQFGNGNAAGFLHLRGEMSWGTPDASQLDRHGLGALKVADLLAALATIPLHEQLKIPEDSLPALTVATMKTDAERNRRTFRPDREYVTDLEVNLKILESLKLGLEGNRGGAEEEGEGEKTGRDAVGAALKLSATEAPDMEVDLEHLVRSEESPSREPSQGRSSLPPNAVSPSPNEGASKVGKAVVKESSPPAAEEPSKVGKPAAKASTPPAEVPPKVSTVKTSSPPPPSKPGFDFGLSKKTGESVEGRNAPAPGPGQPQPSRQPPAAKIEVKPNKPEPVEEPTIDLDKPVTTTKQLPVLVTKTEVENLEDWLDSVLDD